MRGSKLYGKRTRRGAAGRAVCFVVALLTAVLFCLPFVYMLLCSFQPESADIFVWPPDLIPDHFRFAN